MLYGIFIESTTEQGLLYQRYANIPQIVSTFIDVVDNAINHASKKGVKGYEKFDLSTKLEKFKSDVRIEMKDPMPINIKQLKSSKSSIKGCKDATLNLVSKLGKMRSNFRFGNNYINGILIKPKIFSKDIDDETLNKTNTFTRQISRSLDWIEKTLLDLLNLEDQDLNLLTIVSTVYHRKLFEDVDWDAMMTEEYGMLNESIDDYIPHSGVEDKAGFDNDPIEDDEDENDIDDVVEDDTEDDLASHEIDEDEYYPIFPMAISYDFNLKDSQVNLARTLHAVTKGDEYTHSLLSFDTSMEHIWHFLANGMETVSIYDYPNAKLTKSIYISVVFLTKKERNQILEVLEDYKNNISSTKYDFLGFVAQLFGKHSHINRAHICSTFVAYLLNIANKKNLGRDYSEIRPNDTTILPRSFFVMTFKNIDDFKLRKDELDERVQRIYEENIDEIRDYNNILPKVLLDDNIKRAGSIRNFLWSLIGK